MLYTLCSNNVVGFGTVRQQSVNTLERKIIPKATKSLHFVNSNEYEGEREGQDCILKQQIAGGAFSIASLLASPGICIAADAEISELPPPYVPVAVGFALLVAVGLLTNSLGDVLAEEASLGDRSGARAKKEMERSRSSYFKK